MHKRSILFRFEHTNYDKLVSNPMNFIHQPFFILSENLPAVKYKLFFIQITVSIIHPMEVASIFQLTLRFLPKLMMVTHSMCFSSLPVRQEQQNQERLAVRLGGGTQLIKTLGVRRQTTLQVQGHVLEWLCSPKRQHKPAGKLPFQ